MKQINFGILGPGKIANRFVDAFIHVPSARVIAVASRDENKAKEFAKKKNIPKVHPNYEALCNDPEVDVIYIATPHPYHYEQTLLCLNHGKAALCEKPMSLNLPSFEPSRDKKSLRRQLQAERQTLIDRHQRAMHLQEVLRVWLMGREDVAVGAYWPIKGEFDPLPALHRWKEDGELLDEPLRRRIGLPVVNKQHKTLTFHAWYPGCPMEEDAYGIPKPKDTEEFHPELLLVPCVGYGPGGYRLGYGGGFYDRTLATLQPKPFTVGLGFTHGFVPDFEPQAHDVPLDAILNENGAVWPV